MRQSILNELTQIERAHGVRILYACESGSRAWGFASPDSDHDVRFIYAHDTAWYLSVNLESRSDVIEKSVGDLDLAGWDIRKALCLFHKSNPPLMEWLNSPIIYSETSPAITQLRSWATGFYSVRNASYHYFHMARGNFNKYLEKSEGDVWTKKYFYVLRPLLCVDWLQRYGAMPPVLFDDLRPLLPESLQATVDDLLRQKRAGAEMRQGPRLPALHDYLAERLASLPVYSDEMRLLGWEPLNLLFQATLQEREEICGERRISGVQVKDYRPIQITVNNGGVHD